MIAASTAIKWRIIMKLVSFAASGRNSYGAVVGDGVFDLGRRLGDRYPTLRAAIAGDALGAAAAEVKSGAPDIALSQVTLLPPITDPDKIICAGRNYRAHAAEAGGAAVDLDLDDIARLHPQGRLAGKADPLRRTGRDHVACHQRRPIRAVRDQGRDVEDQIVDPGVLDLSAVEPRHQMEPRRVRNLVGGDDPRPKAARRVEVLAGGDRVLELDVPDRAVVEAGVAEDVAQGVGFGDVPARLPDDE